MSSVPKSVSSVIAGGGGGGCFLPMTPNTIGRFFGRGSLRYPSNAKGTPLIVGPLRNQPVSHQTPRRCYLRLKELEKLHSLICQKREPESISSPTLTPFIAA